MVNRRKDDIRWSGYVSPKIIELLNAMVADNDIKSFHSNGELLEWMAVKANEMLDERKAMKRAAETKKELPKGKVFHLTTYIKTETD